mmetsp:Transcript_6189/g.18736  ORF Transcript_6189/g.18736 Transcript_6189/m.18736 type:complete len:325 (-) Transcript_6189:877-1851(-)
MILFGYWSSRQNQSSVGFASPLCQFQPDLCLCQGDGILKAAKLFCALALHLVVGQDLWWRAVVHGAGVGQVLKPAARPGPKKLKEGALAVELKGALLVSQRQATLGLRLHQREQAEQRGEGRVRRKCLSKSLRKGLEGLHPGPTAILQIAEQQELLEVAQRLEGLVVEPARGVEHWVALWVALGLVQIPRRPNHIFDVTLEGLKLILMEPLPLADPKRELPGVFPHPVVEQRLEDPVPSNTSPKHLPQNSGTIDGVSGLPQRRPTDTTALRCHVSTDRYRERGVLHRLVAHERPVRRPLHVDAIGGQPASYGHPSKLALSSLLR